MGVPPPGVGGDRRPGTADGLFGRDRVAGVVVGQADGECGEHVEIGRMAVPGRPQHADGGVGPPGERVVDHGFGQ